MSVLDLDACAEAFNAKYTRLIVTAADGSWLDIALRAFTGYGTSIIGCDAEIDIERQLSPDETPDGRPGVAVMAFAFNDEKLGAAIANRVGQGLLTCPTTAVFDGLPQAPERAPLGDFLRYFGDGHERREGDDWVVPVMEGDVSFPATCGIGRGVAGGNLIFVGSKLARVEQPALYAAKRAADAAGTLPGVITPFPGGVCRSGSKVGSRYKRLIASTNEAYCPTLTDRVETKLPVGAEAAYEVIINGESESAVRNAMRVAIDAAAGPGLLMITAGTYGGRLGRVRIPLSELIG